MEGYSVQSPLVVGKVGEKKRPTGSLLACLFDCFGYDVMKDNVLVY